MSITTSLAARIGGAALFATLAVAGGAAPAGAARPRGVNYGGSSSKGDPVVIVLSKTGGRVVALSEEFETKCTSGKGLDIVDRMPTSLAVSDTGSFSGHQPVDGMDFGGGITGAGTIDVKGKVNGPAMTGSWTLHIDVLDAQKAKLDTCQQTATFKAAARKGRIFAGFTSQDAPVVMELNAAATTIHHFHIGWDSTCAGDGQFQVGDTLLNFDLQKGAFGDAFTTHFGEAGEEQEFDAYTLKGTIGGARASGTFRVDTRDLDPAGATTATCTTGTVTFKATSG